MCVCVCVPLHSVPTPVGSQSNANLSGQLPEVTGISGDPDPQYDWEEVAGHCDLQSPQHTSTLANKVCSHDMQGRVWCVLCPTPAACFSAGEGRPCSCTSQMETCTCAQHCKTGFLLDTLDLRRVHRNPPCSLASQLTSTHPPTPTPGYNSTFFPSKVCQAT